ncbi:MAG: hypothetical protein R3195_17280 [Gemmatimonadota bacterium]|nr:hypothetical protein [Gemmatimonadota bacterium]
MIDMKRDSRRSLPSLGLLLAVAACGGETGAPAWSVVVDTLSNGAVRIVNTPPAEGAEPVWWIEEEVRIGSLDGGGPATFGEVRGIGALPDGRIAVMETQSQEVRVFGPDGVHLATYGGEGQGPGEIGGSTGLMVAPDHRLWVPDTRNARMSIFDADSGYVTGYPMRLIVRGYIWEGVMRPDGGVLKPSILLDEDRTRVIRVFDATMTLTDSIPLPRQQELDQEDPPTAFVFEGENGTSYRSVPFYPFSMSLIDPDGTVWSTTFADPSYRIFHWRPQGDTTLVIETNRDRLAVTPAERDSVMAQIREEFPGAPAPDWSKIPDVKPAISSMHLSAEGQLWVRRPSTDGLTHYDVYDRDGRLAGGAATALGVWPYLSPVVRGGEFWALVTDELDVPYVVRGRLVPFECRSGAAAAERETTCLDR